jgi:hypothetical protein
MIPTMAQRGRIRLRTLLYVVVGLLLLGLALTGWAWFQDNFERRTKTVQSGYSPAARRNPFLAAERFLQRLGVPAESRPGRALLRQLPSPEDTLIVNGLGPMNAARRAALQTWIESGGRLIVEAIDFASDDGELPRDNLLADLGVALMTTDVDEPADQPEVVTDAYFAGSPDAVEIGFLARYYLEDRYDLASGSLVADGLARMLQYEIGGGTVTVTSDKIFMTNEDIGNHDHALFLALLATPAGAGKVWLLYDSDVAGLDTLIWHSAAFAVISAVLLALVAVWHIGGQLGPLVSAPGRLRRDLLTHLQAGADFLWRHGRGGLQLRATQHRVEQAWVRRHPLLRDLPQTDRVHWIATQAGLPPHQVEAALYGRVADPESDFIRVSRTLQRLWAAL